ncbi:Os05g0478800, partial [Oryza sativa Japonica Group]
SCRVSNAGGNGARIERKATMDDKFLWRKYGQKEIKNSKHPRFYYRCSYKDDHGCTATKQVQQSETADDDTASPVYIITYFGEHTCRHGDDAAAMVVDGGEEEDQLSPAQMVISFASSNGGDASVSWPCSGDDAQNNSETSHESSPPEAPAGEEERLRPCTAAGVSDEPIMESTPPAPELLADLKPMDGCLLDGESLFGMDELVYFHELSAALGLLDRDWGAPV